MDFLKKLFQSEHLFQCVINEVFDFRYATELMLYFGSKGFLDLM